jgi:hypothetical protein
MACPHSFRVTGAGSNAFFSIIASLVGIRNGQEKKIYDT